MDRRSFLRLLTAAAAGLALDPERLLWTPKAMITVPAMPLPLMGVRLYARSERGSFVNYETSEDGVTWVRQYSQLVNQGEWTKLAAMIPQARLIRVTVDSDAGRTDLDDMYIIGGKRDQVIEL